MKLSLVTNLLAGLLLSSAVSACTASSSPTGCDGIAIDPQKELVVVEPSVIQGVRARNDGSGALAFRHAVERQGGGAAFVASLFDAYRAVAPERADALESRVVGQWRASGFDLARSPLRLIAVANRVDLANQPDNLGAAGEGRLVFAVTDGPADDPASSELPMTLIFEYSLGGDARAWTRDFHALSRYEAFTDAYAADLEALVKRFDTLSQVRIDDAAFGQGQLFAELAPSGALLAARGLRNTPGRGVDPAVLASLVNESADAVVAGTWLLPAPLRASSIDGQASWALPGVAPDARQAFELGTCSGCHGQAQPSANGFHVAPGAIGNARLSKFLSDPTNVDGDELTRRAKAASTTLCAP